LTTANKIPAMVKKIFAKFFHGDWQGGFNIFAISSTGRKICFILSLPLKNFYIIICPALEKSFSAGGDFMTDMIFGKNSVIEALKSGRSINKIILLEGANDSAMKKILTLAAKSRVVKEYVSRQKLDKICGGKNHQGVIAMVAAAQYSTLEEIFAFAAEKNEPPFLILLDELEDPHNFGAILRTADCVGVHGVIIPKRRNVQLNATVAKTSAGAVEYVKVAQITNVAETLKKLREMNLKIVGSDVDAEKNFTETDLRGGIVLVIGNEGKGMRRLTKENCDLLVKIPMCGKINSLNASVAGAVLMYEIFRQRQ